MHIYIPTLTRPDKQDTLKHIPKKLLKKTHLVINKEEYSLYKNKFPKELLMVIEKDVTSIGEVRQYILENSFSDYSLFLDDDMSFNTRKDGKLIKTKPVDIIKMYNLLLGWLKEGFVHVGISQRAGNNRISEDYLEVTRMNNAYAYNVNIVNKNKIKFDRLKIMEDFDITLSLLKAGFKNRVTYQYTWTQRKSGDTGGCSIYRTYVMQRNAAFKLNKLHPGLVKIKAKKAKEEWGGIDSKFRTDVVISWKKAFKQKNRSGSTDWLFNKGK